VQVAAPFHNECKLFFVVSTVLRAEYVFKSPTGRLPNMLFFVVFMS
jgi:hypothetical protein